MYHFLAEAIQKQELNYSQKPFIPRGLTNRGNWCYINAVSFGNKGKCLQKILHVNFIIIFKTVKDGIINNYWMRFLCYPE